MSEDLTRFQDLILFDGTMFFVSDLGLSKRYIAIRSV